MLCVLLMFKSQKMYLANPVNIKTLAAKSSNLDNKHLGPFADQSPVLTGEEHRLRWTHHQIRCAKISEQRQLIAPRLSVTSTLVPNFLPLFDPCFAHKLTIL